MQKQSHVVILGAGFAGIGALQKLRGSNVRITILDRNDYHTFQPLLYQVATDELAPSDVGFPIREMLHRHRNAEFHQCTVESIDLKKRIVVAEGIAPCEYDFLVIALGAVVNFHNIPGAAEHAFPLYTMNDAIRLKEHLLKMFEAVDRDHSLADQGYLNFCIVGGGPTGTELAGAIAELLHSELIDDYPGVPIEKTRIMLYQHSDNLLEQFKPKLQAYARNALEERGVEVHTGVGIRSVGPTEIALSNGETVKTQTLAWAAGLHANPLLDSLGVDLVAGGRVPVGLDLQLEGYPGVFAIGDCAAMTDGKTGKALPGLGAVALQAGRYVGDAIKQLLVDKRPAPFHYVNKGTMAQVGRGAAVVELPFGGTLTGRTAWLAWLGVHLSLLNGAEAKADVFVDWGWNAVTHQRGKRIILSDEDAELHGESPPIPQAPRGHRSG